MLLNPRIVPSTRDSAQANSRTDQARSGERLLNHLFSSSNYCAATVN